MLIANFYSVIDSVIERLSRRSKTRISKRINKILGISVQYRDHKIKLHDELVINQMLGFGI